MLLIKVTTDDILYGQRGYAVGCPVALAMHRHTVLQGAAVTSINVWSPATGYVDLPESVAEFIRRFDNSEPVFPFTFDLDIPT